MDESSSLQDFFSDPTIRFLPGILADVHRGMLLFPRFQRQLVWTQEMRHELLDSVVKGMPIGTFLEWRTASTSLVVNVKEMLGPFELPHTDESSPVRVYLLDGQQRLSTLYFALYDVPEIAEKSDEKRGPEEFRFYYDLEAEDFVAHADVGKASPTHMPLPTVLEGKKLTKFQRDLSIALGRQNVDQQRIDQLLERSDEIADAIRRYKIPVVPIVSDNLGRVTNTFKRINRQVAVMDEVDMIQALAFGLGLDLLEQFKQIKDNTLEELGWGDLDDKHLLRVIKVGVGCGIFETNPEDDAKAIAEHDEIFDEAERRLVHVVELLKSYCGIETPSLVPYPLQTVLLSAAFDEVSLKTPSRTLERLADWLWFTTYTSVFAGQVSESRVSRFLEEVRNIAANKRLGKPVVPSLGRRQVTRFDFRHARSKALALLFARQNPLDPESHEPLEAASILSREGSRVTPKLVSSKGIGDSPPGARVLLPPERLKTLREMIRKVARSSEPSPQDIEVLESHLIDHEGARLFERSEHKAFVERRRDRLEELEQKHFEEVKARLYPPRVRKVKK